MNRISDLTNRNYETINNKKNEYIVLHYVGAVSSARANGAYFKNAYRGASANYFVDNVDCVEVVKDSNVAWHCGTRGTYYNGCRNTNSIGIEMCCVIKNGVLDIEEAVESNALELTKELMQKYNIPASKVVRHYDVTHKICPAPFVNNADRWTAFKSKLGSTENANTDNNITNAENYLVKVNTAVLNVRREPNTTSAIATQIKQNEIYTITETIGHWGRLKSGIGYICLDYTTKNLTPTAAAIPNLYGVGRYKVNASAGLNVRAGAGTNFRKVKAYVNGTVFDVFETINKWGRTPSGWVCLDYAEKI